MGLAYLALLVACGSALTLSCKWANRKGSSPLGLATVVQLTCLIVLAGIAVEVVGVALIAAGMTGRASP